MIDKTRLHLVLNEYKKDFPKLFWTNKIQNEKYKWVAVKHFQDNWDIDAEDFTEMLTKSLAKTGNLLASQGSFPKGMIINFSKANPEKVRAMFQRLFDEKISVVTRIEEFMKSSEEMRSEYEPKDEKGWKSHYQNPNSISTYLWLRYPDKYYIYKYSEVREVANELAPSFKPTKGAKPETILGAIKLYDEIAEYLATDSELVNIVKKQLDETCYPDPEFRTLTIDVGFYISRYYSQSEPHGVTTVNYAWYVGAVINNEDMLDVFVSEGRWQNGYENKLLEDVKSMKVGDRIAIKSSYTRKNVPFKTNGTTVSVMGIKAIGTITENLGDGRNVKVKWDKVFDPIKEWYFFTARNVLWYVERQEDEWLYGALLDFTFADIPQDYERILEIPFWKDRYASDDESSEAEVDIDESDNVNMQELPVRQQRVNKMHELNTILYGAPGTGKTYSTAQYAVAIAENKFFEEISQEARNIVMCRYNELIKSGQVVFTTFHQNYGYEDFIQGIRPDVLSGEMKFKNVDGIFKKISDKAMRDPDSNYVIIIDEINRANISKVFGELITLIEDDKRWGEENAVSVTLPSGEFFAVPNNLYIVGTMNSADKSISLIDTALRRRFEFVEFVPDLTLVADVKLQTVLERLNKGISTELSSTDLLVGHSYFINKNIDDLCNIMNRNIIPLLYEYFFDNKNKVEALLKTALDGLDVEIVSSAVGRIKLQKKEV